MKRPIGQSYGKITEFAENGTIFYFTLYIKPADLSAGIQEHHSKYELVKTDKMEKEFVASIIRKVEVFGSVDNWMVALGES